MVARPRSAPATRSSASWFAPFLEFRFPRYGTVAYDGVELELRQAIEPWHVLGEEVARRGTARYVDSSVERLQVKVTRHDRRALRRHLQRPARCRCTPTGVHGEFVAGVRYRAWAPPSALHPTIGVHAPLVFDLVDTWSGRSIGGCTYHVAHPGGRNYDTFPVNAQRGRGAARRALLAPRPHARADGRCRASRRTRAFRFTLDLRYRPSNR